MEALIDEICRRVREKAEAPEDQDVTGRTPHADLPKLLILTEAHGTICHEMLESKELEETYKTECALLAEYRCEPKDYEVVIAYTMSNEALGKITHGIFDSGFTRLFGQMLLEGKKIYLAEEGIELYRYRNTAPQAFYGCLDKNLELLKASGVVIAPHDQLLALILAGDMQEDLPEEQKTEKTQKPEELREAVIAKRIITEKDVISFGSQRIQRVHVDERAILTDLAKEYTSRHKIAVVRGDVSSYKKECGL